MEVTPNNYAFIDSQNVYITLKKHVGWLLDFKRFRVYLKDKYHVEKAYLFLGYLETNEDLYKELQEAGYIIIFKPTLKYKGGTTKGNCDAELVLQAMIELNNYDKAVIVTGDGDFYCLVNHLQKLDKLEAILIPNQFKYSALLKKVNETGKKYLFFMNNLREKLEKKDRK